jgi:hypothetical protein
MYGVLAKRVRFFKKESKVEVAVMRKAMGDIRNGSLREGTMGKKEAALRYRDRASPGEKAGPINCY